MNPIPRKPSNNSPAKASFTSVCDLLLPFHRIFYVRLLAHDALVFHDFPFVHGKIVDEYTAGTVQALFLRYLMFRTPSGRSRQRRKAAALRIGRYMA